MVVIKDMKMPSCCANCDMSYCLDKDGSCGCFITQGTNFDMYNSKLANCPLVEIVTCKDCKHWHDDGIMTTCDKNIGHGFPRDYFCADGERGE